jgi:uncharacterized protein (TIGR02145 family)
MAKMEPERKRIVAEVKTMRRLRIFLLIIFFLQAGIVSSQTISNIRVEQQGEAVLITYDLDKDAELILQLSMNGTVFTDIEASGDIGMYIESGSGKKIIYKPPTPFFCGSCVFRIKIDQTPRFVDSRDGQSYKMVRIGDQIWMAENLNYETPSGSWCYDNNPENCKQYGRLYDWETATKVCPVGWHLPSDKEWTTLTTLLGDASVAGGKMKCSGSQNWASPNASATNSSGFSGLPGGYHSRYDGAFNFIGYAGYWWSSTWYGNSIARYLNYLSGSVPSNHYYDKAFGFSVRCLKDAEANSLAELITDEPGFLDPSLEAQFNGDWRSYVQRTIERSIDELMDDQECGGSSGTCEVIFVIAEDGTVSNVEALTMKGTVLARISVDAIKRGPKWKPGKNSLGQPVASIRIQKVTFVSPDE